MVIQSNMSPKQIVSVWINTESIFNQFQVSMTEKPLSDTLKHKDLEDLLKILNEAIGSTGITCIAGG